MNSKTALEKKYEIIKQNLGNQTTFYTDEVIPLFPELKKSTLYWNLSKLVEAGYIKSCLLYTSNRDTWIIIGKRLLGGQLHKYNEDSIIEKRLKE